MFAPQTGVAILETDHDLTERQSQRVKADLRAIGIEAVILPMGLSLAHVAMRGLDDEDDE